MTNLIRRLQSHANVPNRAFDANWDPFRTVDALLRWDPFVDGAVSAQAVGYAPAFEVKEVKDAYVIKADLPGIAEADVDVTVAGNGVTISGKREAEQSAEAARYYAIERRYGAFSRAFVLPDGADLGALQADLAHGVLTVRIPKRPEIQPRKVTLGGGQPAKGSA